jgi:hypothetical protein
MKNIFHCFFAPGLLYLIIFPFIACSQKQGNIWYFNKGNGMSFNSSPPVSIAGGQTGSDVPSFDVQEGTSTIADSSGSLLIYTGGRTIWNRFHQAMPNGTNLQGGTSSTQSSLILPKPGSDSLFYVFTSDEFQSYYTPPSKGYRYTLVSMCRDGGKGDVVTAEKNIMLCDTSTEKLSACRDAAGTGYWVMGHKMFSNEFVAWHLTVSGITQTVSTKIGTVHGWHVPTSQFLKGAAQGQMKFNGQSTKLALCISNFDPAYVDIFDFSSSTGGLSNFCHNVVDSALQKRIYGVEFSPDGTKLYATGAGGSGGQKLYQWDLSSGPCNSVQASVQTVFSDPGIFFGFSGMQLAPDNKIYIASGASLAVINSPNAAGSACNYSPSSVPLNFTSSFYTPPAFIAGYTYSNNLVVCCAAPQITITSNSPTMCIGNTVTLTASGASNYTWSNGMQGTSIIVSPPTNSLYIVTGTGSGCKGTKSFDQYVLNCTGIAELAPEKIFVAPNPTSGKVMISGVSSSDKIEIRDGVGQIIFQEDEPVNDVQTVIEKNGIYIVTIRNNFFSKKIKLVVYAENR